jgi:LacI family repressor for deo operon, udp, cdd, tsx, nupC, and nupG
MSSIKDVAKLAGVSVGTVSNYLNNPQVLKEKNRQLIEKAIENLKYTANPQARNIRSGKTNSIAVITPNITDPFFAELYNSIKIAAIAKSFTPILYTTEDDLELLKDYLVNAMTFHVDGVIMCYVDEDKTVENIIHEIQLRMPIVLITDDLNHTENSSVVIDKFNGIYKATNHLISQGHKKIAYIGGPESSRRAKEKFNGYLKAIKDMGGDINPDYIYSGNYNMQSGYNAARYFSMLSSTPTAITAASDILAIGSLKYFLHEKIDVPEEIAIIGFNNILLARMYEPGLSSIALPIKKMGNEAIDLLVAKMKNLNSRNRQLILNTELIIRNSTNKDAPLELEL